MKKFLIEALVLVVAFLVYSNTKENTNSLATTYDGPKFSFDYPKEYTLTETAEGVTITSIPVPSVNTAECEALEDEQARASCLRPINQLSPNISIQFLAGTPDNIWASVAIAEIDEEFVANTDHTYKYNHFGGEYGGKGNYGLFLSDGLLLASYSHQDSEGGYQFSSMQSVEYKLDHNQQKELLEQILASLEIKS